MRQTDKICHKGSFDSHKSAFCYKKCSFLQAVELQKLILAHNNLEILTNDLKNLSLLTVLNVSHNKLSCIPEAIGE